jgi:hypothetical protein
MQKRRGAIEWPARFRFAGDLESNFAQVFRVAGNACESAMRMLFLTESRRTEDQHRSR